MAPDQFAIVVYACMYASVYKCQCVCVCERELEINYVINICLSHFR